MLQYFSVGAVYERKTENLLIRNWAKLEITVVLPVNAWNFMSLLSSALPWGGSSKAGPAEDKIHLPSEQLVIFYLLSQVFSYILVDVKQCRKKCFKKHNGLKCIWIGPSLHFNRMSASLSSDTRLDNSDNACTNKSVHGHDIFKRWWEAADMIL